ncbi:MAG: hypothetical protein IJJ58_04865, partial [Campylobacter sp.]|nr:hypothetical protein [Campylobacter sp.]
IALPSYNRAVEKSRASGPMANLASIAKAQNAQKLGTAHYTDNVGNLDISLTDEASGQRATGSTFESEYFTYRVYGDDKEVALATRKNVDEDKKYELSVDYNTNKIYCRPITNKTCIDLHLEEGQDYSQVAWNTCADSSADISCYEREVNGKTETVRCLILWGSMDYAACHSITYRDDIRVSNTCDYADSTDGFCNSYSGMWEEKEDGHQRHCLSIDGLECEEWSTWSIPTEK